MKTHLLRLLSCVLLFTLALMPCQGAMFLKIDGIDGESQDASHANEIDVLSFSFGVTQTISDPSGGGGETGIDNTRECLRALYGDQGSLVIDQREEGGTIATLRVPYREVVPEPDDERS
jgi:hypothetical protein